MGVVGQACVVLAVLLEGLEESGVSGLVGLGCHHFRGGEGGVLAWRRIASFLRGFGLRV